jgi:hypothetical protein
MYQEFYNNLQYIGSLLFYEVPYLYIARHKITNDYYLLSEEGIGDDNDSYKWLIFKTSIEVLKQFIAKEFTFFELLKKRFECEYTGKFGLTADINRKWRGGEQIREVRNVQIQTTNINEYGDAYFEEDCADLDFGNLKYNL